MWRTTKVLLILALLAGIALVVFAYVGELVLPEDWQAPQREVTQPVDLGLD
jgi:hypothetical protein